MSPACEHDRIFFLIYFYKCLRSIQQTILSLLFIPVLSLSNKTSLTVDLWIMETPFDVLASQAFHCAEPGSRHDSCLPLFMSLLTYEVYYQTETAEGSTKTEVNSLESLSH